MLETPSILRYAMRDNPIGAGNQQERRMRKTVQVNCMKCGTAVERTEKELARRSGRVFCSQVCRVKWQFGSDKTLHPRWKGGDKTLSCKQCGGEFVVERWMNRSFCSNECTTKNLAKRAAKVYIACLQCKEGFSVNANSHGIARLFCGRSCRAKYWFTGDRNPNWNGGASSERDTIKASDEYKGWRLSVFRRDRFVCVVCLSVSVSDNPIEAHHLKRFIDHPELAIDIDNGCTLCRSCHKITYQAEELLESFLRSRILRDFTSDTRLPINLVKIKSDLRSDAKKLAEMPSSVLLYA